MVDNELNNCDDIGAVTTEEVEEEKLLHNNTDTLNSVVKEEI